MNSKTKIHLAFFLMVAVLTVNDASTPVPSKNLFFSSLFTNAFYFFICYSNVNNNNNNKVIITMVIWPLYN